MSESVPQDIQEFVYNGFPGNVQNEPPPKHMANEEASANYRKMMEENQERLARDRQERIKRCARDIDYILKLYSCRLEPIAVISPSKGTELSVNIVSAI